MKKNEILMTSNYDIFKYVATNRDVLKGRIKVIAEAIDKFDLTDCVPVIVNENMEIIDGQTRFEACKELNLPIYYIKKNLKGRTDEAIISLNTNKSNWTMTEYIEHYVKLGYPVYKEVIECKEKYPFITTSTALCFVTNTPHGEASQVREGKIKKGKIKYSVFGDTLSDFKDIFKECNHVFFIRALVYVVIHGYYNHETEFKKLVKHRYKLKGCANMEQYLQMFEEILNYHRRTKKINIMVEYPKSK